MGAVGVRSFAFGFLSVILGLDLARQGLPVETIGLVFTTALAGSALMTFVLSAIADRLGRRYVLVVAASLMALAGVVFALSTDPLLLIVAALVGTINPAGYDLVPFRSIEQAILPQETSAEERTQVVGPPTSSGSRRSLATVCWSGATWLLPSFSWPSIVASHRLPRSALASPRARNAD